VRSPRLSLGCVPTPLARRRTGRVRCYRNCYPTHCDDPGRKQTKNDTTLRKCRQIGALRRIPVSTEIVVNELGNRCSIRLSYGTKRGISLSFVGFRPGNVCIAPSSGARTSKHASERIVAGASCRPVAEVVLQPGTQHARRSSFSAPHSNARREARLKEAIYRSCGGSIDWVGSVAGALHGMTGEIGGPSAVCTKRPSAALLAGVWSAADRNCRPEPTIRP
jgi:hypothetical protein